MNSYAVDSVRLPLRAEDGSLIGDLLIALLPGRSNLLEDRTTDPERVGSRPAVRVAEAATYRWEIRSSTAGRWHIEPAELFEALTSEGTIGRLQPGQAVGRVNVAAGAGERHAKGTAEFEVVPVKLQHEHDFRQMLDDLAAAARESVLQGFAPAAGAFKTESSTSPRLLYQQFAVMHQRLWNPEVQAAFHYVLARPYLAWRGEPETRPLGTPVKGTSRLARTLTSVSSRRARVPASLGIPVASAPAFLAIERTVETLDNLPNRFVRFALERWRQLSADVIASTRSLKGAPQRRGRAEAERTLQLLEEWLAAPMFNDVERLTAFPSGNQVLLRREGYRQIFETFALVESSVAIDLDIEDPFIASQRNVATLYEYWTFIQLAQAVGQACGEDKTAAIFEPTDGGLALGLRSGLDSAVSWRVPRDGRTVDVDLFFNRSFGAASGSWTQQMRPDASLLIRPGTDYEPGASDLAMWLHFDAKYRVDWDAVDFGADDSEQEAVPVGSSKRADLLKMHAYRDAIRRSAGAFVLFPGTKPYKRTTEDELLPGLGAFPLAPGKSDTGRAVLEGFIQDVIDHSADQASRHERSRYWQAQAYRSGEPPARTSAVGFLEQPPADTPVLLAFVRGDDHREWVLANNLYNVRSGKRRGAVALNAVELSASLILLYGPSLSVPRLRRRTSAWFAVDKTWLAERGYPEPGGETYLCCEHEEVPAAPSWFEILDVSSLQPPGSIHGAPVATTWLSIVNAAARRSN